MTHYEVVDIRNARIVAQTTDYAEAQRIKAENFWYAIDGYRDGPSPGPLPGITAAESEAFLKALGMWRD